MNRIINPMIKRLVVLLMLAVWVSPTYASESHLEHSKTLPPYIVKGIEELPQWFSTTKQDREKYLKWLDFSKSLIEDLEKENLTIWDCIAYAYDEPETLPALIWLQQYTYNSRHPTIQGLAKNWHRLLEHPSQDVQRHALRCYMYIPTQQRREFNADAMSKQLRHLVETSTDDWFVLTALGRLNDFNVEPDYVLKHIEPFLDSNDMGRVGFCYQTIHIMAMNNEPYTLKANLRERILVKSDELLALNNSDWGGYSLGQLLSHHSFENDLPRIVELICHHVNSSEEDVRRNCYMTIWHLCRGHEIFEHLENHIWQNYQTYPPERERLASMLGYFGHTADSYQRLVQINSEFTYSNACYLQHRKVWSAIPDLTTFSMQHKGRARDEHHREVDDALDILTPADLKRCPQLTPLQLDEFKRPWASDSFVRMRLKHHPNNNVLLTTQRRQLHYHPKSSLFTIRPNKISQPDGMDVVKISKKVYVNRNQYQSISLFPSIDILEQMSPLGLMSQEVFTSRFSPVEAKLKPIIRNVKVNLRPNHNLQVSIQMSKNKTVNDYLLEDHWSGRIDVLAHLSPNSTLQQLYGILYPATITPPIDSGTEIQPETPLYFLIPEQTILWNHRVDLDEKENDLQIKSTPLEEQWEIQN